MREASRNLNRSAIDVAGYRRGFTRFIDARIYERGALEEDPVKRTRVIGNDHVSSSCRSPRAILTLSR